MLFLHETLTVHDAAIHIVHTIGVSSLPRKARSILMSMSVYLSARITQKPQAKLRQIFVHVANSRCSVLLWRRCNRLCTSVFVDDVMFSHNGPMVHHVRVYS